MTYEEVFNRVIYTIENYDVSNFRGISDIMDLHNDRMELDKLNCMYPDYISLCNSPEFSRIRQKYCV